MYTYTYLHTNTHTHTHAHTYTQARIHTYPFRAPEPGISEVSEIGAEDLIPSPLSPPPINPAPHLACVCLWR